MAEAKTKPTTVSLDEFLATSVDASRHADCRAIAAIMQRATGEPPVMWGGAIVGFGRYTMKYADGREAPWPVTAFSPRKNDLTIYLMPGTERFAPQLAKLGKHKTAKVCLYIKRLSDVDERVLEDVVSASVAAMALTLVAASA
jgi:hypothetical protein